MLRQSAVGNGVELPEHTLASSLRLSETCVRSTVYTCACGNDYKGLQAWRTHLKQACPPTRVISNAGGAHLTDRTNVQTGGKRVAEVTEKSQSKARKLDAADEDQWPVVYINLASRDDRRKEIKAQLTAAGMSARRFEACTGANAPDAVVKREWNSGLNSCFDRSTYAMQHKMSAGERGCAASHAALWARCAKRDAPILILEDDVELKPKVGGVPFASVISQLMTAVEKAYGAKEPKLLYLGAEVKAWRETAFTVEITFPTAMLGSKPRKPGKGGRLKLREAEYLYQTSSYIIWPAAARQLLAQLPVDAPADCFLSRLTISGMLTAIVVQPNLAWQANPYCNGDIDHTNEYKD